MPLLSGCDGPLSALDPAGPSAREAATLWWGMLGVSAVVMAVVISLCLYAVFGDPEKRRAVADKYWIVGGGILLPTLAISLLLAFGIPAGHRMLALPPADGEAFVIEVTGHQWWWEVRYPQTGIRLQDELHLPAGTPVDVHLRSADVVHSFWVPQLGGKMDMIPGRSNVLRLQADEPGVYRGQCAEFCGRLHAQMHFVVHAHAPEDFERWLKEAQADD